MLAGEPVAGAAEPGLDLVRDEHDPVLAAELASPGRNPSGRTTNPHVRGAAQPWGGNYCSYQLGVDGSFWVMRALGPAQDEVNRRLARADGLQAEPDPTLGGAINLVRPTLADAGRLQTAQRATADQRASFETFMAQRGLNARSLAVGLAPWNTARSVGPGPLAGGRRAVAYFHNRDSTHPDKTR